MISKTGESRYQKAIMGLSQGSLTFSRGKKITCPDARDKLNFRQDNVRRASKKFSASLFFLDKDKLFGNRTSKNFDVLARGTSENLKIFLPLFSVDR